MPFLDALKRLKKSKGLEETQGIRHRKTWSNFKELRTQWETKTEGIPKEGNPENRCTRF